MAGQRQAAIPLRAPSMREVLEALEWARREVVRVNAPDQFRNGIRERRVQQLCLRLLRPASKVGRKRRTGNGRLAVFPSRCREIIK